MNLSLVPSSICRAACGSLVGLGLAAGSSPAADPGGNSPVAGTATGAAAFKTDIEYGKAAEHVLRLDVSVPAGAGPFPVAILIHGGGWNSGDKQKEMTPVFESLTKADFTWFSINYRLAPKYRWPACLDDVQTALHWVKTHAAEYKGNPRRVVLMGYDAGGQLACLAAALAQAEDQVQAVVAFAPFTDLAAEAGRSGDLNPSLRELFGRETFNGSARALLQEASPVDHIKPGLPPFLLAQGDADQVTPYAQSLNFQAKLKAKGVECDFITVKGAPHRMMDWDKFDPGFREKLIGWLTSTVKRSGQ